MIEISLFGKRFALLPSTPLEVVTPFLLKDLKSVEDSYGTDVLTLTVACGCHRLHSNYMLNRGYAYTTIISRKYHGHTLLSHLASL